MEDIISAIQSFNNREYALRNKKNESETSISTIIHDTKNDSDDKNTLKKKLSIVELKLKAMRAELVQPHDVFARCPEFLLCIKQIKNTVPIPYHWCLKSKFMSIKRSVAKPLYQLPPHIEETQIGQIRGFSLKQLADKSVRQIQRDKSRNKLNKLYVDFQVLHDAFLVHKTIPALTNFGELFYEEFDMERRFGKYQPGVLSPELQKALDLQNETAPPPWIHVMQSLGILPCYKQYKIPGINAPIPKGATWGPNGWGTPSAALINSNQNETNISSLNQPQINYWGEP